MIGHRFGLAKPHTRDEEIIKLMVGPVERKMGLVSEDRKMEGRVLGLSIGDNLTLSHMSALGPMGLVLPGKQDQATLPWVKKLSIKCRSPRQPVSALSGCNLQKVAIGRLLPHGVDVLLLDGPTRGVDMGAKAHIDALIDELAHGGETRRPCAAGGQKLSSRIARHL